MNTEIVMNLFNPFLGNVIQNGKLKDDFEVVPIETSEKKKTSFRATYSAYFLGNVFKLENEFTIDFQNLEIIIREVNEKRENPEDENQIVQLLNPHNIAKILSSQRRYSAAINSLFIEESYPAFAALLLNYWGFAIGAKYGLS